MRGAKLITAGFLMALAACAPAAGESPGVATAQSGGPAAQASSSAPAVPDEDMALKHAQCMRKEGVTWWPDPKPGGRTTIKTPKGFDPDKLEKAMEACKAFAPNGGERLKPDAEMLEQARQMAKCMRENGVPNFPDPKPDGSIAIDGRKLGTGPGDPTFDKAEKACEKYVPEGASTERHAEGTDA
ncbi:hypothetical protein [Paractinoplanes atraurantiacus]|uniref:Lipoprotein n=1 Tax=Paractinoplanes atraurantiacus TaxID=1036182 RepID=A0A285H4W5_9ACTN|nr:hypothetical protein [Actinoplanes atraurantiacus]SNY30920.1 hypothetical protein SAMN05421748_103479 [Actinoplanes atraurantiacus]